MNTIPLWKLKASAPSLESLLALVRLRYWPGQQTIVHPEGPKSWRVLTGDTLKVSADHRVVLKGGRYRFEVYMG